METRANYALLGLFVTLAGIVLAGFVVWLGRVDFDREYALYDVRFEGAVNGLNEGGEVRFNGIKVGEVTILRLDEDNPNRVVARIRVDAKTPVRLDSKASLGLVGITGLSFIQLTGGSLNVPLLRNISDRRIPFIIAEQTQLDLFVEGGQDVLTNANEALIRLNTVLSEDNIKNFNETLANIERVTAMLAENESLLNEAEGAMRAISDAGSALRGASQSFSRVAGKVDANIQGLIDDTQAAIKRTSKALDNAAKAFSQGEKAAKQADQTIGDSGNFMLEEVALASQDLRKLVARLDRIASEFERDPRAYMLGEEKPEVTP